MKISAPSRTGWQPLAEGGWLFNGEQFNDARGASEEIYDSTFWPEQLDKFKVVQENVVLTRFAGTARGLHYQIGPFGQAKIVTVLQGRAQLFWLSLANESPTASVNSVILSAGAISLFTPSDCAHGMLALEDNTQFIMKMSAPVSAAHRGEINVHSKSLSIDFACPIRDELLSERDRQAPEWTCRRRAE